MIIDDVIRFLDGRFHPELQEDYDNAGFLVGDGREECTGVLVALDLTEEVVHEAVALGFNLVVTHHPVIFGGVKSITDRTTMGRLLMEMVRGGVAAYAAHTNLDNLPDGVNGILAQKLEMHNTQILKVSDELTTSTPEGEKRLQVGAGMVGDLLCEMDVEAFLTSVKQRLGLPCVRMSGERRTIRRVAICGGAGSFLIGEAMRAGADIYLTSDLKYHDFQRPERGMVLADIGHYESEQFAKEIIYRAISEKFSNFACRISESQQSLVRYI